VRPLGVDVSSGVEGADGNKDVSKIQLFIQRAKE
jgi:phosphoribosylanthranilate isomerase